MNWWSSTRGTSQNWQPVREESRKKIKIRILLCFQEQTYSQNMAISELFSLRIWRLGHIFSEEKNSSFVLFALNIFLGHNGVKFFPPPTYIAYYCMVIQEKAHQTRRHKHADPANK